MKKGSPDMCEDSPQLFICNKILAISENVSTLLPQAQQALNLRKDVSVKQLSKFRNVLLLSLRKEEEEEENLHNLQNKLLNLHNSALT